MPRERGNRNRDLFLLWILQRKVFILVVSLGQCIVEFLAMQFPWEEEDSEQSPVRGLQVHFWGGCSCFP